MIIYLEFEKTVAELEAKINELRTLAANGSDIGDEITKIEEKSAQAVAELYASLTPWQKTLVARHPQRPHFSDFIGGLITALFVIERLWTARLFEEPDEDTISQISTE